MGTPVRLQRYLATAGVAARRKAEELIVAGRVQVNGEVVTVLGTKIDPDEDDVLVDGEAAVALDHFYVLFNKPKACITAVTDDRGRPTVMDYLPNLPVPVKPVGRLDFYTEGVLLLTNDGELAARLLAPGSHVPKTYHVKVHGQLDRRQVDALREGIVLDDGTTTMPAEVEILPGESKHTWLGITIHEGKHRQIHRMIEALGYQVDKLQRVAFATLTFHDLRVGDARELDQQELNALRDLVGLDHSAVARGRWRAEREASDIPRRARAKQRAEAEAEALARGLVPGRSDSDDAEHGDDGDAEGGYDRGDGSDDHPGIDDAAGERSGAVPRGERGALPGSARGGADRRFAGGPQRGSADRSERGARSDGGRSGASQRPEGGPRGLATGSAERGARSGGAGPRFDGGPGSSRSGGPRGAGPRFEGGPRRGPADRSGTGSQPRGGASGRADERPRRGYAERLDGGPRRGAAERPEARSRSGGSRPGANQRPGGPRGARAERFEGGSRPSRARGGADARFERGPRPAPADRFGDRARARSGPPRSGPVGRGERRDGTGRGGAPGARSAAARPGRGFDRADRRPDRPGPGDRPDPRARSGSAASPRTRGSFGPTRPRSPGGPSERALAQRDDPRPRGRDAGRPRDAGAPGRPGARPPRAARSDAAPRRTGPTSARPATAAKPDPAPSDKSWARGPGARAPQRGRKR
jgi:23S rRNA pseudouridine2605 synthase